MLHDNLQVFYFQKNLIDMFSDKFEVFPSYTVLKVGNKYKIV